MAGGYGMAVSGGGSCQTQPPSGRTRQGLCLPVSVDKVCDAEGKGTRNGREKEKKSPRAGPWTEGKTDVLDSRTRETGRGDGFTSMSSF